MTRTAESQLVIGVGNPDRGDDAAGILAAQRVREIAGDRCRVVECTGSLTALLDLFGAADQVVVVDAMVGEHPGRWHRLSAAMAETVAGPASSHGLGVGEMIGLARVLGSLPDSLVVYAIEGSAFAPGEPATPAVVAAAALVAGRVVVDLGDNARPSRRRPRPRRRTRPDALDLAAPQQRAQRPARRHRPGRHQDPVGRH